MLVAFYSLSGNVARFAGSLPPEVFETVRITNAQIPEIDRDFVLITPTYTDRIPAPVERFMDTATAAGHQCLGVIGSGNKNFGLDYCAAAQRAAEQYGSTVLHQIEVWGSAADRDAIIETLTNLPTERVPA